MKEHLDALNAATEALDNEWKKIEKGHADLEAKKSALVKENGGSTVSDSDILQINAGGQIFQVSRGTLTRIKGSTLEALFSGRWEKQLNRDSKGRIFLDVNPVCFQAIIDHLNEYEISPPDEPPEFPTVDPDNQGFLDVLLKVFGIEPEINLDSTILTDTKHAKVIRNFLSQDGHGTGLILLYRGSRDGMDSRSFHKKCDDQGPTVTVIKSSEGYIFGGFSEAPWKSKGGYVQAQKSFLYGLSCHGGKEPVKMEHRQTGIYKEYSIYCDSILGPTFGAAHDLMVLRRPGRGRTDSGFTYIFPPGSTRKYFTGSHEFQLSEVEVFAIDGTAIPSGLPEHRIVIASDGFPEEVSLRFKAEEEALSEAFDNLTILQDAFEKEQIAVRHFCGISDDEIALLNVSGCTMAVKHSTLATYEDSVLFKHLVDENWNHVTKENKVSDWNKMEVAAWAKEIQGLTEDVSCYFQDITGSELIAMDREDIRGLGIERPGSVAIITKAVQKLRTEDPKECAMVIKHNSYCFGKVIDHMRLKAMSCLDVPDPGPPEIREPHRKRFKQTVEYYFPESAKEFLG